MTGAAAAWLAVWVLWAGLAWLWFVLNGIIDAVMGAAQTAALKRGKGEVS